MHLNAEYLLNICTLSKIWALNAFTTEICKYGVCQKSANKNTNLRCSTVRLSTKMFEVL